MSPFNLISKPDLRNLCITLAFPNFPLPRLCNDSVLLRIVYVVELNTFIAHDAVLSCVSVVCMVRRCHDNWCRTLIIRCCSSSSAAQWTSGGKNATDDSQ